MSTHRTAAEEQQDDERPSRLWSGMIAFASFMFLLLGGFHFIGGVVALFEKEQYLVARGDLVVEISFAWWGVAHIALAVAMFITGYALFFRKTWARAVAVGVASVSALTNLAFLSAYPIWYALMILIDVLVIYAVTVHGTDEDYYDY
jgi:cation transport ATPase